MKNHSWTVLVLTADKGVGKVIKKSLKHSDNQIIVVQELKEFFKELKEKEIDLIVYDTKVPPLDAVDAFSVAHAYHPVITSILILENDKFEMSKSMIDKKVVYRMLKPLDHTELREINNALKARYFDDNWTN